MIKRINILLVEDSEGDIFLTKEAFRECNIISTLKAIKDGELAIDYFESLKRKEDIPHLVLLDINLPKISGHQVLYYLKNNETFKGIPVIILTTSSSQRDVEMCYHNHANCYITKPIEIEDFFKAILKIEDFWFNTASIPSR